MTGEQMQHVPYRITSRMQTDMNRGGIQAWERNELPLVPNIPVGAVLPGAG